MTPRISPKAKLGKRVQIADSAIIYDHVVIGDDTCVDDFCILGKPFPGVDGPLVIGAGSQIRSHTVLYQGSELGDRLETGHHVLIREGTRCGSRLRVGSFSDIEGDCQIGDFCNLHSYVHIGKGSRIGHFVWLYSLVTLTNDPLPPSHRPSPVTVEDGAVVCTGVVLLAGAVIGKGAFIAAHNKVSGEIPPGSLVAEGYPAMHVSNLRDLPSGTQHPWMRHYRDRYPPEAQGRLEELYREVMDSKKR